MFSEIVNQTMFRTREKIGPAVLTFLLIFLCLSLAFRLDAVADFESGLRAYATGNYETAIREFLSAAGRGNGDAQSFLGDMYRKGD